MAFHMLTGTMIESANIDTMEIIQFTMQFRVSLK